MDNERDNSLDNEEQISDSDGIDTVDGNTLNDNLDGEDMK